MKPLVSIVAPCYNIELYVDQFMDSIVRQTWQNIELIFVNDGSTDSTEEKCLNWKKRFSDRGIKFVYHKKENGGAASAIDVGLKLFTGEYLMWVDGDDILTDDSIEKKATFLEQNQSFGLVRSDADIVNDGDIDRVVGRISANKPNRFNSQIFDDLIYERTFCTPGCYMARRRVIVDCIPSLSIYRSQFGQNWQLLLPMTLKYSVGYIDLPLYIYRVRSCSHSHAAKTYGDRLKMLAGYQDIMTTVLAALDIDQIVYQQKVQAIYAQKRFVLSLNYNKWDDASVEFRKLKKCGVSKSKIFAVVIATKFPQLFRFLDRFRRACLGSRRG